MQKVSWRRVSFGNVFAFAANYEKTCNLQHSRGKTCHRWQAWKSGQFLLRAEKCKTRDKRGKTCEKTKDMTLCGQWNHLASLVSHRTVNDYRFLLVLREIRWTGGISLPKLQNSPYFCVFKYARVVKQKVCNEAENKEQDWGETFFFSRLTRP